MALKKVMNDEIKKYQGRIYYLQHMVDNYGNFISPKIKKADWIINTNSYEHINFELHHVIKFTHYEQNKSWYEKEGLKMCLILIPKIMHQHLENPIYELSEEEFYEKYLIHKWELLFNKKDYQDGKFPTILQEPDDEDMFMGVWE